MKLSVKLRKLLLCCSVVILFALAFQPSAFCGEKEKWPGVDDSVVGKYAKEHGREAAEPLINTDQGDILLFVFLLAGTIGGFIAGYSWRILMVEKSQKVEKVSG